MKLHNECSLFLFSDEIIVSQPDCVKDTDSEEDNLLDPRDKVYKTIKNENANNQSSFPHSVTTKTKSHDVHDKFDVETEVNRLMKKKGDYREVRKRNEKPR